VAKWWLEEGKIPDQQAEEYDPRWFEMMSN
jgi:hypothetical protein